MLRWLGALVLIGGGGLYIFKEDVRSGLGAEGAIVTSRTISDKRVQVCAVCVCACGKGVCVCVSLFLSLSLSLSLSLFCEGCHRDGSHHFL